MLGNAISGSETWADPGQDAGEAGVRVTTPAGSNVGGVVGIEVCVSGGRSVRVNVGVRVAEYSRASRGMRVAVYSRASRGVPVEAVRGVLVAGDRLGVSEANGEAV